MLLPKEHDKKKSKNIFKQISDKKGSAEQVDWAMSLAIFLFFVVWFFLIVRPFTEQEGRIETIQDKIKEKFEEEVTYTVTELPYLIRSNSTWKSAPIIIEKNFNWSNYTLEDNKFFMERGDRIYLLHDLTEGNNLIYWINSKEDYKIESPSSYVRQNNDKIYVDSKNYQVGLDRYMPEEIIFSSKKQLIDSSYKVDGEEITRNNPQTFQNNLYIKQNFTTGVFDYENFIFADNSMIYQIFRPNTIINKEYLFEIELILDRGFNRYQDKEMDVKNDLGESDCHNDETSILQLSNNVQSIVFNFNKNFSYKICNYEDIELSMQTNITGDEIDFWMNSYQGRNFTIYDNVFRETKTGIKRDIKGIDFYKLQDLSRYSVPQLKNRWNLSDEINFELEVFNRSEDNTQERIFGIQSYNPESENIFTRQYRQYIIDKYGNQDLVYVSIKTW